MLKVVLHFENDQTPYVYEINVQKWKSESESTKNSLFIPVNELKTELQISNNYKFFISSEDEEIGCIRKEIKNSDLIKVVSGGKLEFWLIKNIEKTSPSNSTCVVSQRSTFVNDNFVDARPPTASCASSIATGHSWSNMNRKTRCNSVCHSMSAVSSTDVKIVQIHLKMSPYVPVGLSFSGRVDVEGYDQGIFIDSVLPGGTADIEGQCTQGMLLLEVNGLSLEKSTNSNAMKAVEDALKSEKRGVTLVLAKFESSAVLNSLVKDPSIRFSPRCSDSGTLVSPGTSAVPNLTINTDMFVVTANMLKHPNALPIRDRIWLKMTISDAFLGSDLVDWLQTNVDGIGRRKEALFYAVTMLESGFICDSILGNRKEDFSPQRYYCISPPILERLRSGAVSLFSNTLISDRR